jgi:hypothetical protein
MASLPLGVFALAIALLSALAGALLTWIVISLTDGGLPGAKQPSFQEESVSADDLLRVKRTKSGPVIFVQGKRRSHLRDIEDRETGEETILALKAVLAFAEGWLPALQDGRSSPVSAQRRPAAGAASVTPSKSTIVTAERTRDTSSSQPLELVEEIDALIQSRLQDRPELARKSIRLTHDVQGRPLIYVGREQYRSADEIVDDEVRAFIQETIHIWENQ